ncbi:Avr9/Cf-9 rapidly elicited protein [Quillaja saponaria]|uniref:Avr9/Cf-9 rapidly elicited protein n=1 Tax=Quillaja saponaria TaxID=32244 RepID=A0AAD7KV05_QUISA|nr:Avr9/Cf-9 rapidly elicited protein [Quillaja saponaria]
MNSIFSPFDALFAEFLGKKATASGLFATHDHGANMKQPEDSSTTPSVYVKKQQPEKKSQRPAPRFALELDGLNFFETLVFH